MVLLALGAVASGGCAHRPQQPICVPRALAPELTIPAPTRFEAVEVRRYPHSDDAYTEGLGFYGGALYESTGREGHSGVRRITLGTEDPIETWDLPCSRFGEGAAVRGRTLYQLTWTEREVYVWNLDAPGSRRVLPYPDFGWGMDYDPVSDGLVTTNGSATIHWREPETMTSRASVEVIERDQTVCGLNEVALAGEDAWINVYPNRRLIRVRLVDGHVTGEMDLTALASIAGGGGTDREANGVAWMAEGRHLLVTGKQWPYIFEVEPREVRVGTR